jgi:hypothetical protein
MNKGSAIQLASKSQDGPCARPSVPDRQTGLSETELDKVAAAGGKGAASGNPTED